MVLYENILFKGLLEEIYKELIDNKTFSKGFNEWGPFGPSDIDLINRAKNEWK